MVEKKQVQKDPRHGYRRNAVTGKQYNWSIRRINAREIYQKKGFIYKKLKRLLDVVLSCTGLVLLSPIFLARRLQF